MVRRTGESKRRHMHARVDPKNNVLNFERQFFASVNSENAVRLRWVTVHHSNLRQGVVGAGFEVEATAVVANCERKRRDSSNFRQRRDTRSQKRTA
jgi:hypothetical protein